VVNVWNNELAKVEQQALLYFPSISAGEVPILLQGVVFTVRLQDVVNELNCVCLGSFWLRGFLGIWGLIYRGRGVFKGGDQ